MVNARAVPDAQLGHSNYTHTLTVRSRTSTVRVNLTAESTADVLAVNNVLMWVGAPHANREQKAVLVRVARTYLQHCMAGVTPG